MTLPSFTHPAALPALRRVTAKDISLYALQPMLSGQTHAPYAFVMRRTPTARPNLGLAFGRFAFDQSACAIEFTLDAPQRPYWHREACHLA